MKAFILAAGFGTRMGELTERLPKPLLKINGFPLLAYTLFQLYRWNVDEAVINLHYQSGMISDYLKDFPYFPVTKSYENTILGTAGGVRNALSLLDTDSHFILINPDTVFFSNEKDSPEKHIKENCYENKDCLFISARQNGSVDRGWDLINKNNLLHNEKNGEWYYIGCGLIHPDSLFTLSPGERAEFGPRWIEAAEKNNLCGIPFQGKFYEAGDRTSYLNLREQILIPPELKELWEIFLKGWPGAGKTE